MDPYWLDRQQSVGGPDFVPSAGEVMPQNVTHRSWTMVGTLTSSARAIVDPRGLVTTAAGWSLDWWVGADDRWHTPSREVGVRQRLVADAPVVETLMRIPGGEAVERVYAIHAAAENSLGQDFVVVEVENQSSVPFALALAVVPVNPVGQASVRDVELDGSTLLVNREPGLLMAKVPARAAGEPVGDVSTTVFGGEALSSFEPFQSPEGLGQAAVIFPLPHTAIVRVVMPLTVSARPRRSRLDRRRSTRITGVTFPTALPSAEQVAKGWEIQTRRGLGFTLPEPALESLVDVGRRMMLLAVAGDELAGWPQSTATESMSWPDAAVVLGALGRYGFHDEVRRVLEIIPDQQQLNGSFPNASAEPGSAGAALVAIGEHWQLTRDHELVERLVGPIAKAARWIDTSIHARRSRMRWSIEALEWSMRGLQTIAEALAAIGQPEVAEDARTYATRAGMVKDRLPAREVRDVVGFADVDLIAYAGLSPQATLQRARRELANSASIALDRFAWARSVMSPTGVWPEVVNPRTGGGSRGDGHHWPTGAEALLFVRDLIIRETETGLALCSLVPEEWFGQGLEVHDAPTSWGMISFALRWHGERPALLWDLVPHEGTTPAVLTAPGIDPTWRTTDARGDALLSAPNARRLASDLQVSAQPALDPGESFS